MGTKSAALAAAGRFRRSSVSAQVSTIVAVALVVVFAVRVWQQLWMADDGYIYLTYVQNWTENRVGAVFNRGEYVEGYTSVAWFALLSALDVVRPDRLITLPQLTIVLSMTISIVTAAGWMPIERMRIAGDRADDDVDQRSRLVVSVPLAYIAGTTVFTTFATSGLETPLQMAWLTAAAAIVWTSETTTQRHYVVAAAIVGVAPLIRPDLALPALMIAAVELWRLRRAWPCLPHRRRTLATGVALALVPGLVTVALRVGTYAMLLPNTFYAKTDSGFGVDQGWTYVLDTARPYHLWVLVVVAVAVTVVDGVDVRTDPRNADARAALSRRVTLLAISIACLVAMMSQGGDFMHGRMMITPWFFLLATLVGTGSRIVAWTQRRVGGTRLDARFAAGLAVVAVTGGVVAVQTSMQSTQRATEQNLIGSIADEAAFYEVLDPKLHDFGSPAADPWSQEGRDAARLADLTDEEIGLMTGTIGRKAFYGQLDGGDVYVFDYYGLTQPVASFMQMGDEYEGRVGHNRGAGMPIVLSNERIDFSQTTFDDYDEVFTVRVGSTDFVLINFDLLDKLHELSLVTDAQISEMESFLISELDRPNPDPDFVTFVFWRYHRDDEIRARVVAMTDIVDTSPMTQWRNEFGAQIEVLSSARCNGWLRCLDLAIERQRLEGPVYFATWQDDRS